MFFITCMEKVGLDDFGWFDNGLARTVAFFDNYTNAKETLHDNTCDINERIYNYAVVEDIEQGVYPSVSWRKWFKWDKDKEGFFEIDEPKEVRHFCGFALG